MAPPSNRRPGYSRKAQYGLFATYVLAVAGALVAALLLVISIADPTGFSALRTAGSEVTAPISRFLGSIRRSFGDMGENMSAYFDAASKNDALNREVEANRQKLNDAAALKVENNRLRKLLGLVEQAEEIGVIARLVSTSASSSRRLATLSEGSNKGIVTGQPIRGPAGLVGRIISVGPTTASVLLVTDADNVVPVMRAADGLPAFATGLSNGTVSIRPINLGVNPFKKGDVIVTSGNGGLYPPNIPFALVLGKTDDGATARPFADPGRTPFVMTMPIYEPEVVAIEAASDEAEQAEE
ncbi:MAG: rod shape-determining protein MreC [Sphingorhabdus sp.]